MKSERMLWVGLVIASVFAACSPAKSEILPTYTIRQLTIEAETIILATPSAAEDGTLPYKWKITKVLKDPEALLGHEISLEYTAIETESPF